MEDRAGRGPNGLRVVEVPGARRADHRTHARRIGAPKDRADIAGVADVDEDQAQRHIEHLSKGHVEGRDDREQWLGADGSGNPLDHARRKQVATDARGAGPVDQRAAWSVSSPSGAWKTPSIAAPASRADSEQLDTLGHEGPLAAAHARPLGESAQPLDALVAEAELRLAQEAASVAVDAMAASCASRWRFATATI